MGETLNSSGGGVTNKCDRSQLAEKVWNPRNS